MTRPAFRGALTDTGGDAAVLTNTGSGAGTCTLNDAPSLVHTTTVGTYIATLWARAGSPGTTLKVRLREWSGTTAVGEAKTTAALTTD